MEDCIFCKIVAGDIPCHRLYESDAVLSFLDEMSLDEAIQYMVDLVPYMEEDLARYDLQIYLRRPAYGMNYTIGMAQIEELLAREAIRLGGDFDLGVFHDTFLSKGMIPIALIGWEMSGDDEAYAWLLPD